MKKKQIANIIMIALIGVIVAAGMLGVGYIRGWFDAHDGTSAVLSDSRGIVLIEREGVSYPAEKDTVLRAGDTLSCNPGATFTVQTGEGTLVFTRNAQMQVQNATADQFAVEMQNGEVFMNTNSSVNVSFEGNVVEVTHAVALLSVRSGAQTVSVFSGAVEEAQAGQTLGWVNGEKTVGQLAIQSLNDFAITQLRKVNERVTTCFTNEALDELEAMRAETEEEETIPTETAPTEPEPTEPPITEPSITEPPTEPIPTEPEFDGYCTITIRCDTILDNWDGLDPSKAGFVPDSGVILKKTQVGFYKGETVFDVLQRTCKEKGIQLEYSWTPMYNSYYIEGINHLYEFDCGPESGWMYKVNGWFPNYGCSSYALEGNETIVWCYTCVGLGADVGGSNW